MTPRSCSIGSTAAAANDLARWAYPYGRSAPPFGLILLADKGALHRRLGVSPSRFCSRRNGHRAQSQPAKATMNGPARAAGTTSPVTLGGIADDACSRLDPRPLSRFGHASDAIREQSAGFRCAELARVSGVPAALARRRMVPAARSVFGCDVQRYGVVDRTREHWRRSHPKKKLTAR